MKKALEFFAFLAFTGLLFLLVVAFAFYHLVRVGEFRRFLMAEIEQHTDLKVELGEAHLEIGRILGIAFHDVALSEREAARPAITVQRVTARVALLPLLERKLIFDEIRLQKPTAHLLRDPDGRVPLLDKLLNLPFLKHQDTNFNLDLRAIRIRKGDIELITPIAGGGESTLRLSDTDADITRVRAEPVRQLIAGLMKSKRTEPPGPALQFALSSSVERDGSKTSLKAQGKMLFAASGVELDKAWWNADLQLLDVPAPFLQELTGPDLGITSLTGHLAQRLHVTGNPGQRVQVRGDIEFRQLALEAPKLFRTALPLGDGRSEFILDWRPERLEITRLFFRSKETQFSLQGVIREFGGKDPQYQLNLSSLAMPLGRLRDFLPRNVVSSPELERWATLLQEGELRITRGGIDATLSQIRRMAEAGPDEHVWFDAQVRNASARPRMEGALPLTDLDGQLSLSRGVFTLRNLKARYGESRINDLDGSLAGPLARPSRFELHARGELDLAEFQQQLKLGWFPAELNKFASSAQQLGGRGRVDLVLRRSRDAPLDLEGSLGLDNARLRIGDFALSEVRGELSVSRSEIKSEKVRAVLAAAPVQIQLTVKDYAAENGTFDLMVDSPGIKAGVVTQLLLSTGSLQDPGMVRGSVHYQGPLSETEGRRFTANLDLANVQLAVRPLLQPLRDLSGRVRVDEEGIDFQNVRGVVCGFPASFSGSWRYRQKPQLLFDFAAPNVDITYLLSQVDPESTDFYANLQAVGKVVLAKGRLSGFEFSDLRSDVQIDRRVWRFSNPTMRSAGGSVQGTASLIDQPDFEGFALAPNVQGVPVQSFLKWFDMSTSEITGKVKFKGNVESSGMDGAERKRNLHGAFNLQIEDGTLHRLRILVQILNLLDLSRWFTFKMPDLAKQGIRFRKITGDFKITNGIYSTQNLFIDSDDLRMTGAGKIDVPKDEIDFQVALRPFAGIDTVMSYIPLIGPGIAVIKNSFLVASFNIQGPIDNPTITPAPLNTLSEVVLGVLGIPKNLIGLLGGERPGEAVKDQPEGSAKEKAPAAVP
ncbi:MAG: AsmA-like C-terminal domain-containing protein [Alphaproteobacteria bacterium]